ncbi:unnamed protein product [Spirodela intermedia]|uniref:Non-structural maintenance of chromosomes element 4 n=1 Tax=Spirodela intermedia TaxID=51605 RepID=A0A7I8KJY3_SPIIN|nr:unnamed protein product [Spirodela intermedia]
MAKRLKKEPDRGAPEEGSSQGGGASASEETREETLERRILRSRYLAVKNQLVDGREDLSRVDSDRFRSIITEVEALHQQVKKPREQIADAEALLNITSTLVTTIRSHGNDGLTPSDFVRAMLRKFGQQGGTGSEGACSHAFWKDVGSAVAHVFMRPPGCCTMLGPMSTEPKQRKPHAQRKQTRPADTTRPEELEGSELEGEQRTDTDKNMLTMFDILRRRRRVGLESLLLNRASFAQTVENLFALSFLVKDGRAEITVDDNGHHLVMPRNAPVAVAVAAGEVSYSHFVFRFDFKDWKLMQERVAPGEELMPDRGDLGTSCSPSGLEERPPCEGSQSAAAPPTTPIRKLTRNRGLVVQEQLFVEESPEKDGGRASTRKKAKRLFR